MFDQSPRRRTFVSLHEHPRFVIGMGVSKWKTNWKRSDTHLQNHSEKVE